ncbi:DUF4380 domain-containing protein [Lewinella sp. IMCC34183]|uniref:DUF4380 domain-containing protein n=1 Tax=Lewinella sp. IMCC34183 TaxID=2248762 RepID=UPI0013006331|nr:DUF4380 domain-containing protein [Lewinella sp. IMCC34183]
MTTPALHYPWLLLFLLPLCTCAPPAGERTDGPLTLTRDSLSLTVDPARGGRIVSLRYGTTELLQTDADSAGYTTGSVAWTSPQRDWNWPPPATFDRDPYTVQQVEDYSVLLISARDSLTGLQLQKRYRLGPDSDVGLTYWLTNQGDSTIAAAPWEVTRLPYAGTLTFFSDSVRFEPPADLLESRDSLHTLYLDDRHTAKGKLFASLDSIPAVYVRDGLVLEKHTVVTDFYRVAPEHAPLEIYIDPARGFAEFELQGDLRTLGYGETTTLRTRWVVRRE